MRYIKNLALETISMLKRLCKFSAHYRVRHRAHCILLSFEGYSVSELAKIFFVTERTIYTWFDAWEAYCLPGLYDNPGRGAKAKLLSKHENIIRHWLRTFPKALQKVQVLIQEMLGISVCKKTLQRFAKKLEFSWRRVRQKTGGKPDPVEYEQKKQQLEEYKEQAKKGEIVLLYSDQSGFCLTPCVPYAWQEKGQTLEIPTSHSPRLNVLGFLNYADNRLTAYTIESTVNSQTVIACIDQCCQTITKKTVIVLDQASIHTSQKMDQKIDVWKEKDLHIFFLPTYSPQLNPIEILWRFMKYEWIEFEAYCSWNALVNYVEKVIRLYGIKYEINFV